MTITLSIPDDLAAWLGGAENVSRRALAFGLAEYQAGRLTGPELRRLLGFGTRYELNGFSEGTRHLPRLHAGRLGAGAGDPGPARRLARARLTGDRAMILDPPQLTALRNES
jgi:hypothetical protein